MKVKENFYDSEVTTGKEEENKISRDCIEKLKEMKKKKIIIVYLSKP